MKWIRRHLHEIEILAIAVFVFCLFYKISSDVPLAGDDWGYAVQGASGNPFVLAWHMYLTWSGRLVSEFYGFAMTPHKGVWNCFNALLFTLLYIGCVLLAGKEKNQYLVPVAVLALMLCVNETLRIETYTWMMGTTYVIPLVLFVYYLLFIRKYYLSEKKMPVWMAVTVSLMNLIICLCMENIAAALVFANLLLCGRLHHKKNCNFRTSVILLGVSIAGLLVIRLSPGAASRLSSDNAAFNSLSLLEQIATNWTTFLKRTFIDNTVLILSFSAVMALSAWQNMKQKNSVRILCVLMHAAAFVMALAPKLYEKTGIAALLSLYDVEYSHSAVILCSVFYILYMILCIVQLWLEKNEEKRDATLFYLLIAGCADAVMLLSPIFGARSSLYTYYFLLILTVYEIGMISLEKIGKLAGILCFGALICLKTEEFKVKYTQIAVCNANRESIIAYYRDNPSIKEAWIPRMPSGWIHSADIEAEDTYHMEVFKEYYGLADDVTVIFYQADN